MRGRSKAIIDGGRGRPALPPRAAPRYGPAVSKYPWIGLLGGFAAAGAALWISRDKDQKPPAPAPASVISRDAAGATAPLPTAVGSGPELPALPPAPSSDAPPGVYVVTAAGSGAVLDVADQFTAEAREPARADPLEREVRTRLRALPRGVRASIVECRQTLCRLRLEAEADPAALGPALNLLESDPGLAGMMGDMVIKTAAVATDADGGAVPSALEIFATLDD